MAAFLEDHKLIIEDELEFYKKVLHSVNASIQLLKVDIKGNTLPVWTNNGYTKILGYSLEERHKLGLDYQEDELYHPEEINILREKFKKIKNSKEKAISGMCRIKSKEGKWKWVLASIQKIYFEQEHDLLLNIMIDITDHVNQQHMVNEEYIREIKQLKNQIKINNLTAIEKEIIKEIVRGKSTNAIANQRKRSYETINNHKRNIFKKLEICKINELISIALESGLN